MVKNLEYYLNLPWTYSVESEEANEGTIYIVRVNEWPRVVTDAPTTEEAMTEIKEVLAFVIEGCLEKGRAIPEPS